MPARCDPSAARARYRLQARAYHAVASPLLVPIRGVKMRLPKTLIPSEAEVRQMGPLFAGFHPVVPDNGYNNFLAAVRKRCNYHSTARASDLVITQSHEFINLLVPTPLAPFEWSKLGYAEWLSAFGPEKRARMDAAIEDFSRYSLDDYRDKDIFVKTEALLVGHKPNWAPRIINKGTDIYNAVSGPIFRELMNRLAGRMDSMDGPHRFRVAYKKTPEDYIPFISHFGGEYVESDFSANDMRQCADVQVLECALMRRLGCPEWFVRLHASTDKFKVRGRAHGFQMTVQHQLPTGATDTTFRNSFWNACILYTFLKHTNAVSSRAIILGDDMLAKVNGLKRNAAKTYENIAKEAQMVAKVSRHSHLVDCSFLSKCFVPRTGGVHLTVPLPGKALARFNMRANRNQAVSDAGYMAGKSVGYAYEFRFFAEIRDLFLDRFNFEFEQTMLEKKKLSEEGFHDALGWNARDAGITLKSIRDKIVTPNQITDSDWHGFCYHRYGLSGEAVINIFSSVVLVEDDLDVEGQVATALAADFL